LNSRAGSLIGKRSFESVTRNARPSSRVWTRIARSTWCWRCHHRDAIERWSGNTRGWFAQPSRSQPPISIEHSETRTVPSRGTGSSGWLVAL